jgi:hypothetical protein
MEASSSNPDNVIRKTISEITPYKADYKHSCHLSTPISWRSLMSHQNTTTRHQVAQFERPEKASEPGLKQNVYIATVISYGTPANRVGKRHMPESGGRGF